MKRYEKLTKKAKKHLDIAVAKGAKVNTEVLYKSLSVEIPGISIDFPFKPVQNGKDTVYFDRDGVEVQIVYKRDQKGSVSAIKPIINVAPRDTTFQAPVTQNVTIECDKCRKFIWLMYGIGLGVILTGVLGFIFRTTLKAL